LSSCHPFPGFSPDRNRRGRRRSRRRHRCHVLSCARNRQRNPRVADKPFVYALRDKVTGLILVAGYAGQPNGKTPSRRRARASQLSQDDDSTQLGKGYIRDVPGEKPPMRNSLSPAVRSLTAPRCRQAICKRIVSFGSGRWRSLGCARGIRYLNSRSSMWDTGAMNSVAWFSAAVGSVTNGTRSLSGAEQNHRDSDQGRVLGCIDAGFQS
jgi:hypothetical protein